MNNIELLRDGLAQLKIVIKESEQETLLEYLALLVKWNKVYNLTAIRDSNKMVSNHLLDSLAVLPYLWPSRWLDVGCGAGLPGIVLAIARPEWKFALLDSNSKKTSFVQQAVIELGLKNVSVYCERVDLWQANEKFDGIISRAFAEMTEFIRLTRHLISENGQWAAMKGIPEQELKELPEGCEVKKIISLQVPGLMARRCLVIAKCKGNI